MTDPTARHQRNRRRARAAGALALATAALLVSPLTSATSPPAAAKTPGRVYCFHGICHRVRAIEEVARLIGDLRVETASFYGTPGRRAPRTSSGEAFNAASRHRVSSSIYPDGTELLVWNPRNGRAAHVRVNDLGPFHASRTLDLTRGLADDLGFRTDGVVPLKVFVVSAPSRHEARHDSRRVYAPTGGYLGTLDEDRIGELADDLVDRALLRTAPAPAVSATAALSLPTATTPEITIIADTADSTAEPPQRAARTVPAQETAAPAPIVTAAAATTSEATHATTADADVRSDMPHERAADRTGRATTAALVLTKPATETLALPVRAPDAREPIRSLSLAASPASRGLLAMALVLTLGTILLARLRRRTDPLHAAAPVMPRRAAEAATVSPRPEITRAAATPELSQPHRPDPEPQMRLRRRIDPAQIAARRERALRHASYLADAGLHAEAEAALLRILQDMETALGSTSSELARPLRLWADSVRDTGRTADALHIYERALALATGACPPDNHEQAAVHTSRARLHLIAGTHAHAVQDASRAVQIHAARGEPLAALDAMLLLAEARTNSGDTRNAEVVLRDLLALAAPREHVVAARAAILLASSLAARGDATAATHLDAGLAALDRHLGLAASGSPAFVREFTASDRAISDAVAARRIGLDLRAKLAPHRPGRHHPVLAAEITPPLRRAA